MPRPLVVLVAGPTAVGKTALSIELAQRFETEIVNADSMQIYCHMDIGTAKPTAEERAAVPHRLIDIAAPDEPFDAARYAELARPVLAELHGRGKISVVTGGTGLYMKVLTQGICEGPGKPDPEVRERLELEERERGLPALHAELAGVDPPAAARIHPNDRQRILRALEVFRSTGEPLSYRQSLHRFAESPYSTVKIFLEREREELASRIERRVDAMMAEGFLDEVRRLLDMGYGPGLNAMQSLGYKQLCAHLTGGVPLGEAVERIKTETRRYAKRQRTWFRGDPEFRPFRADDTDGVFRAVEEAVKRIGEGAGRGI